MWLCEIEEKVRNLSTGRPFQSVRDAPPPPRGAGDAYQLAGRAPCLILSGRDHRERWGGAGAVWLPGVSVASDVGEASLLRVPNIPKTLKAALSTLEIMRIKWVPCDLLCFCVCFLVLLPYVLCISFLIEFRIAFLFACPPGNAWTRTQLCVGLVGSDQMLSPRLLLKPVLILWKTLVPGSYCYAFLHSVLAVLHHHRTWMKFLSVSGIFHSQLTSRLITKILKSVFCGLNQKTKSYTHNVFKSLALFQCPPIIRPEVKIPGRICLNVTGIVKSQGRPVQSRIWTEWINNFVVN